MKMSDLEEITMTKNGKNVTKYAVKQKETTKHKINKKIEVSTPKEKFFLYVKSNVPFAKISKGKIVKTSSKNKNKFYPYHVYIFKKNRNGENNIYLETTNENGYYLKKLFRTEFDEIEVSCENKTQKIKLGTTFSFKHGKFVTYIKNYNK